jgi:DMSO reductase family type II enzyme chaperone
MISTNTHGKPSTSDVDRAYCRAALYSALALGFQAPTEATLTRLMSAESQASLTRAATLLYGARAKPIIAAIDALPPWTAQAKTDLPAQYHHLFGHNARGQVSPYETEYGNEALFQQPQELGDLMGFYHAFGLTVKAQAHERADHISCEYEFMMFLALKEAYALEHRDPEMAQETRRAEELFLRDRLGRFLPAFVVQIEQAEADGFYRRLGDLSRCFVSAEAERLQVSLGAANLGLRPAEDNQVPMACGNGADCGLLTGADQGEESEAL